MLLLAALCSSIARRARADDVSTNPLAVEVHGFVSQGFMLSSSNNYLTHSRRGSFEISEVGLNVTKNVTDKLSIGMQLFMRDLGPLGNYKPQFDWYYLDYRFWDWLGLRAGRIKLPFGLYNDQSDIDAARVPILLPQSLYPTAQRDYLLAQTGGEVYGYVRLGDAGALDYRVYGGTVFLDSSSLATVGATVTHIDVPYIVGGRVMWRAPEPLDGLSAGGSLQFSRIDLDMRLDPSLISALQAAMLLPPDFNGAFKYKLPAALWVGSLEYAAHDVLLAAEYSRWRYNYALRPQIVPDGNLTLTRWYVMGSYRASSWFSPGIYYSVLNTGNPGPKTREKYQQDVAVTARYDLTQNWLVKLEGHYMHGTAALDSTLNSDVPTSELTRDWAVFMLKTTAFF